MSPAHLPRITHLPSRERGLRGEGAGEARGPAQARAGWSQPPPGPRPAGPCCMTRLREAGVCPEREATLLPTCRPPGGRLGQREVGARGLRGSATPSRRGWGGSGRRAVSRESRGPGRGGGAPCVPLRACSHGAAGLPSHAHPPALRRPTPQRRPVRPAPARAAFLVGAAVRRQGTPLPSAQGRVLPVPRSSHPPAAPRPCGVPASRGFPTATGSSARPGPSVRAPRAVRPGGSPREQREGQARVTCWAAQSVWCGRPRGPEHFVSNRFPWGLPPRSGHLTLRAAVSEETLSLQGSLGRG